MDNFLSVVKEVWQEGFLGIGITEISISLMIIIMGIITRGVLTSRIIALFQKISTKTESALDDVVLDALKKPLGYVPITLALYVVTVYLPLSGTADIFAQNIVKAMIAFTIFSTMSNAVKPLFTMFQASTLLTASMTMWLERAARVIIWIVGIGIILDIFGVQIGPLVAGLGLFSVAVALGAQDLFKNLIAGILIIGENRFQPGDRIEVEGQLHGVVESIGFRSTLIRTFNTAPMLVPNKDLSDVRVINHGEMKYRRISWTLNLVYSTTQKQLANICDQIEKFIAESDLFAINPDQAALAKTDELGSSSIDIRVICYTEPMAFTEFAKVKQALIFEIINIVRGNGSEFAYPSTSIYLEKNDPLNPEDYLSKAKQENVDKTSDPDSGIDE
jgi:MscS family membrane protein